MEAGRRARGAGPPPSPGPRRGGPGLGLRCTCRPRFSRPQAVPAVAQRGPRFGGNKSAVRVQEPDAAPWALGLGAGTGSDTGSVAGAGGAAGRQGSAGSCAPGSQSLLRQLVRPLHTGVRPQGVLKHEVPEHLHPRVVLWQVVVVLGRDLPHLQRGRAGSEVTAWRVRSATHMHTCAHTLSLSRAPLSSSARVLPDVEGPLADTRPRPSGR